MPSNLHNIHAYNYKFRCMTEDWILTGALKVFFVFMQKFNAWHCLLNKDNNERNSYNKLFAYDGSNI